MPDVVIRTATDADVGSLVPLLERWGAADAPDEKTERYRERLESIVANPMHHVIVAELDGELVGYAAAQDYGPALRRDWSIARMHDLWVAPESRGHGAGTALFEAVRDWAARETSIRFLQWQSSEIAVDFYRTLGLEGDADVERPQRPEYEIEFHLPGQREG